MEGNFSLETPKLSKAKKRRLHKKMKRLKVIESVSSVRVSSPAIDTNKDMVTDKQLYSRIAVGSGNPNCSCEEDGFSVLDTLALLPAAKELEDDC